MISREFRERLSRRASKANVSVSGPEVEQLEAYYRLLARWNSKVNLTALQLGELNDEAVDRLLVEPLVAACFVPDSPLVWFDLGSGGGSPAIPLKIARPAARLTMVESKTRKAAFLREAVRALGLANTSVENARFEEVAALARPGGTAELLTVRAVKTDEKLFGVARALMREGGRLLMFRSNSLTLTVPPGFQLLETARLVKLGKSSQIFACVRTENVSRGTEAGSQTR